MKRAAVIALLAALSILNLYSAFALDWSRRYFPLPLKSDSLRKGIHIFFGVVLILCVLLLIYAAVNPRG